MGSKCHFRKKNGSRCGANAQWSLEEKSCSCHSELRASATDVEANSNRASFSLAMPRYKRQNGTPAASKTSREWSMIDLESQ
jgi:hypothetical protein